MIEAHSDELRREGFCVLRRHLADGPIAACREAFEPGLTEYLGKHGAEPNRGPSRHFLPMPFDPPCFAPEFFFDEVVLRVVRSAMDERVVADQWGCDVALRGSQHQEAHADYQRPLFGEAADLMLPPYILTVSFGLNRITLADGPIEIAPGTHRMRREEALTAVQSGDIGLRAVPLEIGDVLIRHPWALHRGTPNLTDRPRAMATVRYVRRWYADSSREVCAIPRRVWEGLAVQQRELLRFPVQPD